ncbi:MAG TPA: cupin-like domain-containing protein, partial [Saprospiraceae bacterium]|nr:cupin-like domain-containing protein [Saprospiraceae bacterium]
MKLFPVDRRTGLNRETFKNEYLKPSKPVVFTDFMDAWPAKEKWNNDFFKEKYGDLIVPLFSEKSSNVKRKGSSARK